MLKYLILSTFILIGCGTKYDPMKYLVKNKCYTNITYNGICVVTKEYEFDKVLKCYDIKDNKIDITTESINTMNNSYIKQFLARTSCELWDL